MARPVGLVLPRTITLLPEPSVMRMGQPKLNSPSSRLTASVTKPRVSGRSDDVPPGNIGTAGDGSTKVAIASALTPRRQLLATTIIQYPYVAGYVAEREAKRYRRLLARPSASWSGW